MVEQVWPMAVRIVRQVREAPIVVVTHVTDEETVRFNDPSPALYASSVCVLVTPAEAMANGPMVALLSRSVGAACKNALEQRRTAIGWKTDFRPTLRRLSCKPRC